MPQNIPDSKSEPIATNPTNVLTSPLQAFADFNHGSSTGLTTKQPELFHHNNNAINGSFKIMTIQLIKSIPMPLPQQQNNAFQKPYERSPLMKPSVTIASIDTIAKLKLNPRANANPPQFQNLKLEIHFINHSYHHQYHLRRH